MDDIPLKIFKLFQSLASVKALSIAEGLILKGSDFIRRMTLYLGASSHAVPEDTKKMIPKPMLGFLRRLPALAVCGVS